MVITSTKQFWSSKPSMLSPGIPPLSQSIRNDAIDSTSSIQGQDDQLQCKPAVREWGWSTRGWYHCSSTGAVSWWICSGCVRWCPSRCLQSQLYSNQCLFCVSLAWKTRCILCSHSQNSVIFQAVTSTSTLVVSTATEAPREATPRRHAMFLMVMATILDLVRWICRTAEI